MKECRFTHAGIACMVRPYLGHWCGYVVVPEGHPWHGCHYDDIEADVHGGLTYSKDHEPGDDEVTGAWCVGFDTGHYGDDEAGRNCFDLARDEVRRLAEQAATADVVRTTRIETLEWAAERVGSDDAAERLTAMAKAVREGRLVPR